METWLLLAVFAQFLFAISVLIDKHIVARAAHIGKPIVYAFYVALLSGFVLVFIPFGVALPHLYTTILSVLYATAFLGAIYFLYSALKIARASDVAPVVGGVSAIATLALAAAWIDGDVTHAFVFPVLLLAGGTAIISHFHFSRCAVFFTIAAGICFGLAVFFSKLVFLQTTFIDGFFWTRMFTALAALSLLLSPALRRTIFSGGKSSSRGAKMLVVGNKMLGSSASILTAFAISLGSVAVVNALAGLQFVFLFLFAILFARHIPFFSEERTGDNGGWHTAFGVTLIVAGLATLYLA